MEKRESALAAREEALNRRNAETEALYEKGIEELERISGLTTEQAKEYLLRSVEAEVKHDTAKMIKEMEKKPIRRPKTMWLLQFRDVRQIMWLRARYRWYSFRMTR